MDCCPVQYGVSSDVASCNHRVVNCKVGLGVESVMVACDGTNLDLGATSSRTYEISYEISISNSSNRLYHLDFSTINTYLQPFNLSESVNV